MGTWKHNGSPKRYFRVEMNGDEIHKVKPVRSKDDFQCNGVFELKRVYYQNKSDGSVRKVISTIKGSFVSS